MPEVTLRPITLKDCTEQYVNWLRDPTVNKWLETRHTSQTIDTVRSFIKANTVPGTHLMAIIADDVHVGNIKVGPINEHHKYAQVSYFIGERSAWNKGIATRAVRLACSMAFNEWKLHTLQAGVYRSNYASRKVLLKAGFSHVGTWRRHLCIGEDKYEDHDLFDLINERPSL